YDNSGGGSRGERGGAGPCVRQGSAYTVAAMLHPVLTILVAGSFHLAAESPRTADLAQIVYEITQVVATARPIVPEGEAEPTVCDIPFYYSDFTPLAAPEVAPLVTYDWRSPVIFDLP